MSVLLDTGVLFAFVYGNDERHEEARAIVRDVALRKHGTPFVTDFVVDELLTLARVRTASAAVERAARRLLPLPEPALPGLRILHTSPDVLRAAVDRFEAVRRRGFSFTDAALVAAMREHDVDVLATFDRGFRGLVDVVP